MNVSKNKTACLALLLICLVANPFSSFAQKKRSRNSKDKDKEEKLYDLVSNDPEDTRNLHVSISPFFFDLSVFNGAVGADLAAYYSFMNKFAVHGIYQYGLYYDNGRQNGIDDYSGNTGVSASKSTPFRNLQFGGTYFFKNDLKDYTENVVVKSESKGNMTTNYYIPVPAKYLTMYGARIGFQSLKSNISAGSSDGVAFVAKPKDGSPTRTFSNGDYTTMMGMNVINLGVSRTKITDLVIDVTGGLGERSVKDKREVYLDLLYAPVIVYSDMIIKDQNLNGADQIFMANVNDSTAKSRFGIRAGYNVYSPSVVGLSYGFEGGLRPGPGSDPLNLIYINVRIALCISAKI